MDFTAWVYGLRNNGDLWGKVFFLGFRLGILGIWFYGDLGLRFWAWDFGLRNNGDLGIWFRDFLAWDFGNMVSGFFGLGFWAWDFGNMVSGFFGLIFGCRAGEMVP